MLSLSKHLSRFVEFIIAGEMLRQAQHDNTLATSAREMLRVALHDVLL